MLHHIGSETSDHLTRFSELQRFWDKGVELIHDIIGKMFQHLKLTQLDYTVSYGVMSANSLIEKEERKEKGHSRSLTKNQSSRFLQRL